MAGAAKMRQVHNVEQASAGCMLHVHACAFGVERDDMNADPLTATANDRESCHEASASFLMSDQVDHEKSNQVDDCVRSKVCAARSSGCH